MKPAELAQRWRTETGKAGAGGVIVIFDGTVCGWVNELRDPAHWQPGAVAVDEAGQCWKATFGTAQNGALMWVKL